MDESWHLVSLSYSELPCFCQQWLTKSTNFFSSSQWSCRDILGYTTFLLCEQSTICEWTTCTVSHFFWSMQNTVLPYVPPTCIKEMFDQWHNECFQLLCKLILFGFFFLNMISLSYVNPIWAIKIMLALGGKLARFALRLQFPFTINILVFIPLTILLTTTCQKTQTHAAR